ncbi:MAG: isopropylmalate isomerase [Pseudomonadota bacterium]
MTDEKDQETAKKSHTARNAAIGAAATIGSAAIAAALLYVGRRSKKTSAEEPPKTIPSGENPETD